MKIFALNSKLRAAAASLMGFVAMLFSTAVFAQSSQSLARSEVAYLGVVGPGAGAGAFGHVFILFAKSEGVLVGSTAYQYNFDSDLVELAKELLRDWSSGTVADAAIDNRDMPLRLSKEDGYVYSHRYSLENRKVEMFKLRLTQMQIDHIRNDLNRDYDRRQKGALYDYSPLTRNCATLMIDALNRHIPIKLQIPVNLNQGKINILQAVDLNAWLSFVPTSLSEHASELAIVDPKLTYTMLPAIQSRVMVNLKLSKKMDQIAAACNWSAKRKQVLKDYLFNMQTRVSIKFNHYLADQFTRCQSPAAAKVRDEVIDLLIFDFEYYSNIGEVKFNALNQFWSSKYSNQ